MAKYAASHCATGNANDCVQILGARGFVSGLAERYYRDARVTQIYGGATDIQKMIVADMVVKELKNNEFSWFLYTDNEKWLVRGLLERNKESKLISFIFLFIK